MGKAYIEAKKLPEHVCKCWQTSFGVFFFLERLEKIRISLKMTQSPTLQVPQVQHFNSFNSNVLKQWQEKSPIPHSSQISDCIGMTKLKVHPYLQLTILCLTLPHMRCEIRQRNGTRESSCSAGSDGRETAAKTACRARSNSVNHRFILIQPEMVTVGTVERLTKMVLVSFILFLSSVF